MTTIEGEGPDKSKLEAMAQGAEADPTGEAPPPDERTLNSSLPKDPKEGKVTPISSGRGRGRPHGSKTRNRKSDTAPAQAVPQSSIISAAAVKAIIMIPYDLAAKRLGEHWRLSPEEAEAWVPVHIELAERYLPADFKDKHAALYTVAILHLVAIFARAQIHYELRAIAARQAAEKAVTGPTPVPDLEGPKTGTVEDVLRPRVRPGPKERPPGT